MSRFRWLASLLLAVSLCGAAMTAGRVGAASSQVFMNQVCRAGKSNVTFSWQGNDTTAQQQWLDISTAANGWPAGSFISAGPRSGATTSYTWTGLTPATQHFVRINQQLGDGNWLMRTKCCVAG